MYRTFANISRDLKIDWALFAATYMIIEAEKTGVAQVHKEDYPQKASKNDATTLCCQ